jgi:glutathione synthase/RimK-type ligase-like ATP-grasp enzyme
MESGVYEFCLQEHRAALLGQLLVTSARWMSDPTAIWKAEHKLLQLSLASQVGLSIPQTVITNDPAVVRTAFSNFRGLVVKPVTTGHVAYQGQEFGIFTSQVLRDHLDQLESVKLSPAIYQQLIPKRFDIRATIVGERIISAAIDSQSDPRALIDWRRTSNPRLPHYPVSLPEPVTARLLKLMKLLNLNFGAVDLIQTPDDDYVFLEINPNGQWLWIDDRLQLGISEAIADWLAIGSHSCQMRFGC